MSTYPRTFSHIGISVPDVEKAAKFYSDVMGWHHIMEPQLLPKSQTLR
jgi:catechol 2,3-dioxygenase-like lactoylglutathione lyase family enzyme